MGSEQAGDILIERFEVIACSKCSQPIDVAASAPFTLLHCPVCGAEMRVPARFANFILLSQLGKGGMGSVYKAYDETLGRTVALKVMQQSIGQDRAFGDLASVDEDHAGLRTPLVGRRVRTICQPGRPRYQTGALQM